MLTDALIAARARKSQAGAVIGDERPDRPPAGVLVEINLGVAQQTRRWPAMAAAAAVVLVVVAGAVLLNAFDGTEVTTTDVAIDEPARLTPRPSTPPPSTPRPSTIRQKARSSPRPRTQRRPAPSQPRLTAME